MKHHMGRSLKFWVQAEYKSTRHRYPNLKRSEVIAGILSKLESLGYASRYIRNDGELGWRPTDEMRQELFTREQDAIYEKIEKIDELFR